MAGSLSELEREVAADLAGVKEMFKSDPLPRPDSPRREPEKEETEDVAEVEQDGGADALACQGFHSLRKGRKEWRWID